MLCKRSDQHSNNRFSHILRSYIARGIVIWNGLKENITITNCEVFNNNCCGIELQTDRHQSYFENNNIHDNGDNGIEGLTTGTG
ncbi:MAG: right-handed parallel beta-helix repeat-containing protein [Ignavibacteria bacterium]